MKEIMKKVSTSNSYLQKRSILFSIITVLLVGFSNIYAADRYWVGGTGNWNNTARWSTTSGGAGGASVPVAGDNIFIDANSGSGTITINVAAVCNNLSWTSNALTINGTGTNTLTINGNLSAGNGINWTMGGNVTVNGTVNIGINTVMTLNGAANTFNGNVTILGTTGSAVTINNATFNGANNQFYQRYTFTGDATFGVNTVTTFLGGAFAKSFQDLVVKQGATVDFQTLAPAVDQFTNIYLESSTTFRFNEQSLCDPPSPPCTDFSSIVTGKIVVNTTICTTGAKNAVITSTNGDLSNIRFDTDQEWNNVNISNIFNVGSANIRVKSGIFGVPSINGFEDWVSAGRRVYWIGGTRSMGSQDWNDCLNWATSSGGTVEGSNGVDPPTSGLDTVYFDANSFSASRNQVVINTGAGAKNMIWTGATHTPTLAGTTGSLTITGNLVFIPAMNVTTTVPVVFSSNNVGNTITMAGKSFNGNVDFISPSATSMVAGTGSWNILDNLSTNSTSTIRFQSGTFNSNNNPITTGFFNANSLFVRSVNLGSSLITVNGIGNVLDLINGPLDDVTTPTFDFNPGTSTMVFNNSGAGNIQLDIGRKAKTLPNFVFSGFDNDVISINTSSDVAERITFQNITVSTSGLPNATLTISGKSPKTYGAITFANNIYANFDGVPNSTPGSNNIFNGAIVMGIGTQVNFNNSNTFNQNVTVSGTSGTGVTFTGDVAGINNIFNGTVSVPGINSKVAFANEGNNNFNQNILVGGRVTWSFNSCASCLSTVATGRNFIVTAACGDESLINSSGQPTAGAANVNFGLDYQWENVTAQNLNNSTGVTVNIILGGSGSIGNTNINVATTSPRTLYWVGGTGNWSNANMWSTIDPTMGVPNNPQCPPRLIDNVIFNNGSGPATYDVTLDTDGQANNISFNGTTSIPTLRGAATRTLTIAGNFTLAAAGSLVQNANTPTNYQGRVIFTNLNPVPMTPPSIALRGTVIFNNVAFGSVATPAGSAWNLDATNGNLTVVNKIELVSGTLNTNGRAVNTAFFDANPKGLPSPVSNLPRTLTLGNTIMTITGAGTASPDDPALDLRGSNLTVTVPGASSRIDMTNVGNIIVYTGSQTGGRTLPRIDFTANVATANTITVNTENNTDRLTFRELNINANRTNLTFLVNGTSPKTYSTGFNLGSGASNGNITVVLDGSSDNMNPNIFDGLVTLGRSGGAGITATIRNANVFNNNVIVRTTTTTGITFTGTGNNNFDTDPARTFTFANTGGRVTFSNTGTNSFANITMNSSVIMRLTPNTIGNNTLSGILNPNANCNAPATLRATTPLANLNASVAQSWSDIVVNDINSTGANITILSKDLTGSTGNFTFTPALRNLYWVGGRTDNTLSTNTLWSNPNNWSEIDPTSAMYNPTTSPGVCIPNSCSDNVFFNAGSFTNPAKVNVNIDVVALCGNMDWTGATNTPNLSGTTDLTICGSLTFINAMTQDGTVATYSGTVTFRGEPAATAKTITMAGKRLNNANFTGSSNTSEWNIQNTPASVNNTFHVLNTIRLIRGRLNVTDVTGDANPDVICNVFDADNGSDLVRRLDFGADALIQVRGTGDVLDLAGNTGNFTITYSTDPTGTSTIELNNAGNINVYVGTQSKTIPNLNFSTASGNTINISDNNPTTNPTTNRITFRNITVANNRVFNMQTNAPKTYGDITGTGVITFGNNTNATFNGTDNPALATVNTTSNVFNGTVTFGTGTRALFNNNNLFNAAVQFGSTTTNNTNTQNVYFSRSNTFMSTLTFTNAGPGWATFGQNGTQNIFEGAVAFNGLRNNLTTLGNNTSFARYYSTLYVNSGVPGPEQSTGTFNSQVEYRDNVTWGDGAGGIAVAPVTYNQEVDMHNTLGTNGAAGSPAGREFLTGIDSRFVFNAISNFRNMRHGQNNLITYNRITSHDNYFLTRFDIVLYPNVIADAGTSVIRQRMEAYVDCNSWIRIASTLPTEQANLQFNEPHTNSTQPPIGTTPHRRFEYTLFQDINKVAAGGAHVQALPANTADISNNTDYNPVTQAGINFINPITKRTFYWVRSVNQINAAATNASGDWADEALDNHWSSPDLPVMVNPMTMMPTPNVGGFGGSGLGPSGCIPTPIDSVVFDNNSLASTVVTVDKYSVYSNGQNWANTVPITLQGSDVYTIHVYGTFKGSPNTTNNFGGTYFFTGTDTQNGQIESITSNTQRFFGPVVFNNERDRWVITDNMNIENNARGSFTINYGIVDMGGLINNPTPPTLTLDGNFTMTARVSAALRVPLFIPRNSTVIFDGKNNDQEIRMDGNTTNGQMKSTAGCVECTQYTTDPTTNAHVEVVPGVTTLNPPANSTHLDSRVISCNRSPFYNIIVDKRWDRTLNIQGQNGAIALSIYNDFKILNGRVVDNGNQIRGNVTNPLNTGGNSGVMEMSNNTALILGSNGTPTVFPTCFRTANISLAPMPRGNVYINPTVTGNNMAPMNPAGAGGNGANNSPEVRYICRDNRQMVAGTLDRTFAMPVGTVAVGPAEYGTLTLAGVTGAAVRSKDLTGPITIHGTLRILGGNIFRDMGKQITGNNYLNTTAPQTFNMIFINGASNSDRAVLELGTAENVAASPLTYSNTSLPANIPRPLTTAADPVTANVATTFPSFTNNVANFVIGAPNTGKMVLREFSTVIYNAGANQQVWGNFTYGNLTVRSPGRTALPLVRKTVTRHPSILTDINLDVAGDLRLEDFNDLIDDGWQIDGRVNKTYTALPNSRLTLGISNKATEFPKEYVNANINLDATNDTYYNAGALSSITDPRQIMSTVPTYGSLVLSDPDSLTNLILIEKRFQPVAPVSIKGDITVKRHNHLNDNGSQISRLTAGGVLTLENGDPTNVPLDSSQVTRLTLGSATSSTTLPLNFTTTLLNDNTTVVYTSGLTQLVAGGTRLNGAPPNSYYNVWLQSLPAATPAVKNLEGAITVRNDLVIRHSIRFNDANSDVAPTNAFQITGNATGNLTMEASSELRLNKANTMTSTVFPTNFIRTRIGLHTSSKVIYNSNVAQDVSSVPMYGCVIFRKFTPTAPMINKTITTVRPTLDVRGDSLRIEAYNHLIDNGVQIDGTSDGFMFMDYRSQLTLGTPATATTFPMDFLTSKIDMDIWSNYPTNTNLRPKTDMNFVVYNSDQPQNITAASPSSTVGPGKTIATGADKASWYGNVRLSSTVPVTKFLQDSVNIRGGLYIGTNNTLDATTNNYKIYLGGDWEASPNSDFIARQGRVILDGIDRTQNITTDAAPFYNLEINKPGTNRTAVLLDPLRLTNLAFYKGGFFISDVGREFIYDVNANHSTEWGTGKEYTTADPLSNGPSASSHVFGPVTKIGVSDVTRFYFPVGNTSVYAPAGIRAPAGANPATTITGRYFGTNSGLTGIDATPCPSLPMNNVSTAEYWTLDAPGGTTAPTGIQVTLSWAANRSGGVTNSSLLRVAHYYNGGTGLKWYCEGRDNTLSPDNDLSAMPAPPFAGGMVTSSNTSITVFSPFTLGSLSPVNPLPIQLVKFEAKAVAEKKIVELFWQTATEINNDFFTLEKSKDGRNFIEFKRVPSKNGNSRVTNDYFEIDTEPMRGLSYYRLKQTDIDGTFTYSKIVAVYFEGENSEGGFLLYPNPAESDINIQIFDKGLEEGMVSISDMLGREVYNTFIEDISPDKVFNIQFKQSLSSGVYILKFVGRNKSYVRSFVVNK